MIFLPVFASSCIATSLSWYGSVSDGFTDTKRAIGLVDFLIFLLSCGLKSIISAELVKPSRRG